MNKQVRIPTMRRRCASRGVTLIEVMVVVVILGLIAAATAVAVFPNLMKGQEAMTLINARVIRTAAQQWRSQHGDGCPTTSQLRKEDILDRGTKTTDAWDAPFNIVCEETGTTVLSAGRDRQEGTKDDIRVPEADDDDRAHAQK